LLQAESAGKRVIEQGPDPDLGCPAPRSQSFSSSCSFIPVGESPAFTEVLLHFLLISVRVLRSNARTRHFAGQCVQAAGDFYALAAGHIAVAFNRPSRDLPAACSADYGNLEPAQVVESFAASS
jgi:hypothetical protein